MPLDRQDSPAGTWWRRSPQRQASRLPAFCRSRRPPVAVTASSLAGLQLLTVLGLLFQLSTLLLVLAGPVPPRLTPLGTTTSATPLLTPFDR